LVNSNKIPRLLRLAIITLQAALQANEKTTCERLKHLKFNKASKSLAAITIIAVISISAFVFLPKQSSFSKGPAVVPQSTEDPTASPSPQPTKARQPPIPNIGIYVQPPRVDPGLISESDPDAPGIISTAWAINSTVWRQVASAAWNFYQPGVGVDAYTWLPYAGGTGFKAFTDWDLGVYVQSIIDAQNMSLIDPTDANQRLDKVLRFLENRPLNNTTHYPFWFYDSTSGQGYQSTTTYASNSLDMVDTGRLFVALSNLKAYNTSWTQRIDNFVYNVNGNRTSYSDVVPSLANSAYSNSIYAYYFVSGYAHFWPQQVGAIPGKIMDNIVSSKNVTTYNVTVPYAPISCEPLLCSFFELSNNSKLTGLVNQVYLAHEAYYNATGQYVAFSEGNSPFNGFIYEWVVGPNGSTWVITNNAQNVYYDMDPVVYTKVAFSFLALYNTTYARNMVVNLEGALPSPKKGYCEGADISGIGVEGLGTNTNGLILDAALFAVQNNP
jgi:hypothetical protein